MGIHIVFISIIAIQTIIWAIVKWKIKKELKEIDGFYGVIKGRKDRTKVIAKL